MADLEDVTLDGRPLQSLRVADLKAALEERGLSKSGQKNALVKRLKGALMLENLQKTSTPHVGLQPNSQIGEEMSQNSFIKQYLAKQQELLRQRLEREAREAYDTNEQEDHIDVNNSTAFLPQAKDLNPASADQHKAPGPSDGEIMFVAVNEGEANSNQEAHMSAHPASGSVTMNVTSNEHRRGKSAPASDFLADSDDDESEDGEEDGDDDDDDDDDDWGSNIRRRTTRQPARALSTRERCGASRQQQQQHIPSLLSPQLRQPTPPPSPPPELSFPLPDTPKQSPPSPDVAAARHSPSTSSSGSSSSDSRSSSPEPQKSGLMERKPGPLTLLARKMESEGAFAGAGWQGGTGQGGRNDSSSPVAASFDGIEHAEGLSSTTTVDHVPVSMIPGINQGISGTRSAHSHVPVSVHKTHTVDDRESEFESVEALELQRQRLRSFNQEPAIEDDQNRALQLEQEENERFKHQQALEREEQEALQKKLASERERLDREQALAKELEVQEQTLAKERALELESQRELERQRALEQERLQQEAQEREKEREIELEKIRAREEKEKALEKERLEREKALEAERKEKERIEKERILEQERLERERLKQEQLDREKALEAERKEKERIERERALEQERLEREKLEQERLEREKALEAERKEKERIEREKLEQEREKALEAERREKERIERERAMEQERLKREKLEQERLEKEKALELERLEREKALEKERQEREAVLEKERQEREEALKIEREKALELERMEREKALEKERQEREAALEKERQEREAALEKERQEREAALEKERQEREAALEKECQEREAALEKERQEREAALEKERQEQEAALEKERQEQEAALEKERQEREAALEKEQLEREEALKIEREKALELERIEREKALEQERLERERVLEREREKALELERLEREKALELERLEREKALELERLEREKALELEREKAIELERLEREKALELERLEREKAIELERLEREKALELERLEREKALELERLEREKALELERQEKEKALELERLEKEKALELERQEKEKALQQQKALELQQIEKLRAFDQERLEKERLDHECLAKERLEKENLETACQVLEQQEKQHPGRAHVMQELLEQRLASDGADEAHERLKHNSKEHVKEVSDFALKNKIAVERIVKERANEQELIERETPKELDTELPPSEFGSGLGLTPPTPPFSTGPDRKTEAGIQEDGKAPLSKSESQEAESSLSSQPSSLRKLRFLRDHPIQAQSATSMATKWPHNFTDTPQPQKSLSYSPVSFREQQEGKTSTKQECNSEEQFTLNKKTSAKGFTNQVSGDNLKDDTVRQDEPAKKSTKRLRDVDKDKVPSSPVNAVQLHGRDGKREEKKTRKRSSSNDSSSSESDSGSSSSRSSSSSSSLEKVTISRNRRERKPDRTTSPLCIVTAVAQDDCIQETQKASPYKRERSVEKTSTRNDEASQAKKPFLEIPAEEQMKRKYGKGLEEKEEGSEQRQAIESSMEESEKLLGANEEARKAFSARKISLVSSKSPGTGSTDGDQESGTPGGRKRRWGSSTVATAKKPSISITTDSLKSLIPDIRPCTGQDAVVDLHPEEVVLSDAEEDNQELSEQDLQIRRTVTQVPSDIQENGQKPTKRICEDLVENNIQGDQSKTASLEEKPVEELETRSPSHPNQDVEEINTVAAGNTLIRRSISQQKTGVSITIDDPVRTTRQPSPPRGKVSNIVHVSNLVRPFTLGQLKELLGRTGTLVEDGFWIDKIKSHCYVTYSSSEEAVATREALHGVKWPQSNPKVLTVDFCQQDELDFHKGLSTAEKPGSEDQWLNSNRFQAPGLPPLLPKRDQWAEREREMERREKARSEREWDRDKVRDFGKPRDDGEAVARRSRSRERRRKERGKSKDKKTEKKEKATEEPPAKLLDDLFRKTKAVPCIYWLPLTDEQFAEREAARAERMKEREKRLKQQQHEDEEKKREDERKERTKGVSTGDRGDGRKDKDQDRERERDRDRGKDRDNEKRRDGYRRPGAGSEGGSRRSRSRSDPRDRRR
ncbi:apoptotic chromatin condensation inducer in the nucleus isoform X2 [Corythoichthys intestinalis]|uniref:apoptotic chromatin condensation inducer in the nucleus isoform X2 n=1 Tax=Corythoichthys intestinalis TaxID=161448 RepID=UPI0025A4E503|nr:apoptotic chromatin condensation inducer in the nucleus isoform X2 [Corythoichthys intestinalis]